MCARLPMELCHSPRMRPWAPPPRPPRNGRSSVALKADRNGQYWRYAPRPWQRNGSAHIILSFTGLRLDATACSLGMQFHRATRVWITHYQPRSCSRARTTYRNRALALQSSFVQQEDMRFRKDNLKIRGVQRETVYFAHLMFAEPSRCCNRKRDSESDSLVVA